MDIATCLLVAAMLSIALLWASRDALGLKFWTRVSDGSIKLLSRHPPWSPTWLWSVSLFHAARDNRGWGFAPRAMRRNQWQDRLWLPFGWRLVLSRQDYHRRAGRPRSGMLAVALALMIPLAGCAQILTLRDQLADPKTAQALAVAKGWAQIATCHIANLSAVATKIEQAVQADKAVQDATGKVYTASAIVCASLGGTVTAMQSARAN